MTILIPLLSVSTKDLPHLLKGRRALSRCTTRCCTHCLRLNHSGRITSRTTGRSYVAMKNVTCKSSNLIYRLSCRKCGGQYVGQTQQTLMKWVYAHIYSINTKGAPDVARHFNSTSHRDKRSDHPYRQVCALRSE